MLAARRSIPSQSPPRVVSAKLIVDFDDKKKVIEAVRSALSPEVVKNDRFIFSILAKDNEETLSLQFTSSDLVSLRAGMNTILRLSLSALRAIHSTSNHQGSIHRKTE